MPSSHVLRNKLMQSILWIVVFSPKGLNAQNSAYVAQLRSECGTLLWRVGLKDGWLPFAATRPTPERDLPGIRPRLGRPALE